MTAGHCVASPSTNSALRRFYTNFMFVPAYNNGSAPFSAWSANVVATTNEWWTGDGTVPNAQDVGMMVMNDQNGYRIGDLVGWFGYLTSALAQNELSMIGYPANLDSGEIMERNDSGASVTGSNNTVIYGTAFGEGASGGPWVQDFGVDPTSTGAGNPVWPLGKNYIVGVTSYGPTGTQGYEGASILDSSFVNLLNLVCEQASGNC